MQCADATGQFGGVLQNFRDGEVGVGIEFLLQCRPVVPGHEEIKVAPPLGFDSDVLRKKTRYDAAHQPFFVDQGGAFVVVVRDVWRQSFQHVEIAARFIANFIEERDTRFVQDFQHCVTIDGGADPEPRGRAQRLGLRATVFEIRIG